MNFFTYVLEDVRPKEEFEGWHLIVHDPFVVPSDASTRIQTLPNRTVEYFIDPKIIRLDETLAQQDPEE